MARQSWRSVRVVLSNEFGWWPFHVGAAQIALHDQGSAIVAGDSSKPAGRRWRC